MTVTRGWGITQTTCSLWLQVQPLWSVRKRTRCSRKEGHSNQICRSGWEQCRVSNAALIGSSALLAWCRCFSLALWCHVASGTLLYYQQRGLSETRLGCSSTSGPRFCGQRHGCEGAATRRSHIASGQPASAPGPHSNTNLGTI